LDTIHASPNRRWTLQALRPDGEGKFNHTAFVRHVKPNSVIVGVVADMSEADREAIVSAYPRTQHFKEDIIQTFYDGIKHKPETTFGNVKADVLADKDPKFQRMNFCSIIRGSQWKG
jgi:hypothetical protein